MIEELFTFIITATVFLIFVSFFILNSLWIKSRLSYIIYYAMGYFFYAAFVFAEWLKFFSGELQNVDLIIIITLGSSYLLFFLATTIALKSKFMPSAIMIYFLISMYFAIYFTFYEKNVQVLNWYVFLFIFPVLLFMAYHYYIESFNQNNRWYLLMSISWLFDCVLLFYYLWFRQSVAFNSSFWYFICVANKVQLLVAIVHLVKSTYIKSQRDFIDIALNERIIELMKDTFTDSEARRLFEKEMEKLGIYHIKSLHDNEIDEFLDTFITDIFVDTSLQKKSILKTQMMSILNVNVDDEKWQSRDARAMRTN